MHTHIRTQQYCTLHPNLPPPLPPPPRRFGDTVNTASRMETTCIPGHIHVSADTMLLLTEEPFKPTGGVEVKGKGRMETYLWTPMLLAENSHRARRRSAMVG